MLEKKISSHSKTLEAKYSSYSLSNIKIYLYKDIYMGNYGNPIYDKYKNLIGYKIAENKYASVETYYNNENLLSNKASIRDFDEDRLSFKDYVSKEWIDTKVEGGFVREFNKKRILLWWK